MNEQLSRAEIARHAMEEVYDPQPQRPDGWAEHTCGKCRCTRDDIMAAGGRCPRTVPLTEPGPLAELREPKPPRGALTRWLLVSVALVAACYVVVDLASRGWTAL